MAVAVTNGGPTIYSITLLWQAHYKRHSKKWQTYWHFSSCFSIMKSPDCLSLSASFFQTSVS